MESTPLHIHILAEHSLIANGLRHRIQRKFASAVRVSVFCDLNAFLRKVDRDTELVVSDRLVEGRDLLSIARQVRAANPYAEVIAHEHPDQVLAWISAHLRSRLVPEAAAVFAVA